MPAMQIHLIQTLQPTDYSHLSNHLGSNRGSSSVPRKTKGRQLETHVQIYLSHHRLLLKSAVPKLSPNFANHLRSAAIRPVMCRSTKNPTRSADSRSLKTFASPSQRQRVPCPQ